MMFLISKSIYDKIYDLAVKNQRLANNHEFTLSSLLHI